MNSSGSSEKIARRALWLLPIAVLTGAVLGPLQYLLHYSAADAREVTAGLAGMSLIGGVFLGVIIGGLIGATGYLLARGGRWSRDAVALIVMLTAVALWTLILWFGVMTLGPLRVTDLLIPVSTSLAAGGFIMVIRRPTDHRHHQKVEKLPTS